MSDQSARPARRPPSQPFSQPDAAVDQPLGERLLPVERSPFSVPADHASAGQAPVARPAGAGRRPLEEGGLTYTGGTGAELSDPSGGACPIGIAKTDD